VDGGPEIEKEFFLRLGLVSDLDPYDHDADEAAAGGEMFLVLEPESAGYVVMGPTLQLLKALHPRLPVTFFDLFTGALNRWIRVYDHRDALERVEQLREWYEADPEGETVELPAVDTSIPDCLRGQWNPLKERFVEQLAARARNKTARTGSEEADRRFPPASASKVAEASGSRFRTAAYRGCGLIAR
jgi:hypothetical protein